MWEVVGKVAIVATVAGLAWLAEWATPPAPPAVQAQADAARPAPTNEREAWAVDFLAGLGNSAPTPATIAMVVEWTLAEDSSSGAFDRNNPLNSTICGHNFVGSINSDGACGVGHYATYQDGVDAAIDTVTQANFSAIVAALQGNDAEGAKHALWASPWAESHYGYGASWPAYQVAATSTMIKAAPVQDWQQHINAGFYSINCGAWGMQPGCQHFGTDIGGNGEGTPVFAPYGGSYTGCQDNGESGPYIGKWIEYTVDDGARFLINHFRDSPLCGMPSGTRINAGDFIGTMRGDANHVHIQVNVGGTLVDFSEYWNAH